ncbi:hypothetical protein [Streptomyces qinzhouensis]|uniref:Sensor domain-containing protein n=1 Tax=Streptomyces qinzhouensis TaxID=2599401 RepID=A0A5B8IUD5_9ACTN|nr:hypothetical protein [Streptomyces qinzhouensis]QDY81359.1 hypothetical protein FQU76_28505 [Streptomyces qinzhouensis]
MTMLRSAAVTTAALGFTFTALSGAGAAAAPAFLSASQLPPALTQWTAGPVTPGLPDDFCTGSTAPRAASKHRLFHTELDTGARQTITVAASEAKAKQLVTNLREQIATCFDRMRAQNPDLVGGSDYYGALPVEEGAHVYGIDTADPVGGANDAALYSVGRDGRTVTVVAWGQLGDVSAATVTAFRKTTVTAVAKLY